MAVLVLSGWLSQWYGLPQELLLFIGVINLLYASYSFTLARRPLRRLLLIRLLVYANTVWAVVCIALVTVFWSQVSVFGILHLVGEAVFVGTLAAIEWKQRYRLVTTDGIRIA